MTKVIILNSSPRANGNTEILCRECADAIEKSGLEAEIISFRGKNIRSCIACNSCKKNPGKCAIDDDGLNEIIEKIKEAKGLIVASPVYFGTARGDLMSAIQRISMVSYGGDRFLSKMAGGPIAVGRRGGHTSTIQELLMFYFINDMIVAGSDYWNIAFGKAREEVTEDEEGIKTIRKFGENVAMIINSLSH
ncbi:flavodoxin family protein [Methanoplanus sp. FWC-SCC4]|uniref:Flavodoxin family protein n=1 Tax=Methanochimaera problematica TaxID=2609417 RepID=A0AA97FGI2_9EURY|nr:flavodoxin family protein [Methanoplanus sp. FWC-SCC4]WOF17016.1 flavodoxin family protein [Methanoplanus sp. FWC-SCC4]